MLKRWVVVAAFVVIAACSGGRKVGDKVMVEWKGSNYPAEIIEVVEKGKYKIHYTGYDKSWDETVTDSRILGAPPK